MGRKEEARKASIEPHQFEPAACQCSTTPSEFLIGKLAGQSSLARVIDDELDASTNLHVRTSKASQGEPN